MQPDAIPKLRESLRLPTEGQRSGPSLWRGSLHDSGVKMGAEKNLKSLPLDDLHIAAYLGATRQQVINLRKTARERLLKRMSVLRERRPD